MAQLVDLAHVAVNPVAVAQRRLGCNGHDDDVVRIGAARVGADAQRHLLISGVQKEAVDVVTRMQLAAVDCEQVVALPYQAAGSVSGARRSGFQFSPL